MKTFTAAVDRNAAEIYAREGIIEIEEAIFHTGRNMFEIKILAQRLLLPNEMSEIRNGIAQILGVPENSTAISFNFEKCVEKLESARGETDRFIKELWLSLIHI